MEVKFEINDLDVSHYTEGAKNGLKLHAQKYTIEIIREANKVEEMLREPGASPEITESTIYQAARRNKTLRKEHFGIIILKILSEILLFISGLLFIPEMFKDKNGNLNITYLVLFLIFFTISLILTITMHFKDGE